MERLHAILPPPARTQFVTVCEELLLIPKGRVRFEHSTAWTKQFPTTAGVYVVFEFDELAYVGEGASIRARMANLLRTQQHTLRRNLGEERFNGLEGFQRASSSRKFPDHIEAMVIDHMQKSLTVKAIELTFGRLEVEQHMICKHNPYLNRKVSSTFRPLRAAEPA